MLTASHSQASSITPVLHTFRLAVTQKKRSFKLLFTNRCPKLQEILLVYAVNVVILYTFSLWFSFQDFSRNWILFLDIGDVLGVFAYIVIGAFIESLLIIGVLIFVYFLFPPSIAQGRFVLYGTIMTITFLVVLILRFGTFASILSNNNMVLAFFTVGTLILSLVAERVKFVRSAIEAFADRCLIFLYVYLPLSLLAVIIVAIRNIG